MSKKRIKLKFKPITAQELGKRLGMSRKRTKEIIDMVTKKEQK